MPDSHFHIDLIDEIPSPAIVRTRLAESIKRTELLKSLLRVAIRKASFDRAAVDRDEEAPLATK
jgi:hypothetical protein